MTTERPDVDTPDAAPPLDRSPGPTGPAAVLPMAGFFVLALGIVGLLALGGWVAFAFAIGLLVVGVFALVRYVQRLAWTRKSRVHLRHGLSGMNEDLSVTDDAHTEVSPLDIPPDNPAHREVEDRLRGHERPAQRQYARRDEPARERR